MKKSILILLTAGCLLSLTACSKPEERIQTTAATETLTTQPEIITELETEPSEASDVKDLGFVIYQGSITEYNADSASLILQDSGIQDPLTIDISTADMENAVELAPGAEITIFCATDSTSAVLVTDHQEFPSILQVQGNVTSQAMSTFSVTAEDGTELFFLKNGTEGLNSEVLGTSINENNGTDAIVRVTYAEVSLGDGGLNLIPLKTERVS